MSRTLSVEQISTLISQLPTTKFSKIDWRSAPKLVARIVKALINSKDGIVALISKDSGVHNQTLYAVMRGKTPDGGKEWPELREALSKMKCKWRESKKASEALLSADDSPPAATENEAVMHEAAVAAAVAASCPKPVKKRKSKATKSAEVVSGRKVSKIETKYFDLESKELVVIVTTRYTLKDWQKDWQKAISIAPLNLQ